jgi:GNAT superfamily N-acetyltransferase
MDRAIALRPAQDGDGEFCFLVPEYQRRGIGSSLLDRLIREAEGEGLPIHLRLLKVNPALSLYERKGFRVVRREGPYIYMERAA